MFTTRVTKVERKSRVAKAWKVGDEIKIEREDLGWFVLLNGSWEALFIGFDEPTFKPGDYVTVTIEKQR